MKRLLSIAQLFLIQLLLLPAAATINLKCSCSPLVRVQQLSLMPAYQHMAQLDDVASLCLRQVICGWPKHNELDHLMPSGTLHAVIHE